MAWIRVETGIARRKVVFRLAQWMLDEGHVSADVSAYLIRTSAVGLIVSLWGQVGENCSRGDIADVPDLLLEEWAGWGGTPRAFAQWVRSAHVSDGRIRDWDETNGPLDTRRESNRKAARAHRQRLREKGVSADVPADGADTSAPTRKPRKVSTNERTDEQTTTDSPDGESSHPRHLPALRERSVTAVRDRLAQVTAEVRDGTRERLTAEQSRKLAASVVFAYWAAKTGAGDRVLFDTERERRIVKALAENGNNAGELFFAVDGALRDPWHNGRKDGTKRFSVAHIFRNREKIEELASLVHGYAQGHTHPTVARYAEALASEPGAEQQHDA